jgi:hypothetical protein
VDEFGLTNVCVDAFAIFRPFLPVVSRIAFILILTAESGLFYFYVVRSEHHIMATGEQLVLVWSFGGSCVCSPLFKEPVAAFGKC